MDEKYSSVKNALSALCGIPAHLLRLAEVSAAQIKVRVVQLCVATCDCVQLCVAACGCVQLAVLYSCIQQPFQFQYDRVSMFVNLNVWGFDLCGCVQQIGIKPCDWRVDCHHCPAVV
jgi:hypothetical protein